MCFLVGTLPNGECFKHELGPVRSTVGRLDLSTICIDEGSISALHAEFIPYGGRRFLLRDLRSTNGTIVDGHRISEAEIKAPCTLAFGRLDCELQPCDSPECLLRGSSGISAKKFENRDQSARVLRDILVPEFPKETDEDSFERDLAECRSWAAASGLSLPREITGETSEASAALPTEAPADPSKTRPAAPPASVPPPPLSITNLNPAGAPRIEIVLPKPPKSRTPRKETPRAGTAPHEQPLIPPADDNGAGTVPPPTQFTATRPPSRDPHPFLRQLAMRLIAPTPLLLGGTATIAVFAVALLHSGSALGPAKASRPIEFKVAVPHTESSRVSFAPPVAPPPAPAPSGQDTRSR